MLGVTPALVRVVRAVGVTVTKQLRRQTDSGDNDHFLSLSLVKSSKVKLDH